MCETRSDNVIWYTEIMKKTPRNKMIETSDEVTKTGEGSRQLGKRVQQFFFPGKQRTIDAESYEEALELINKEDNK